MPVGHLYVFFGKMSNSKWIKDLNVAPENISSMIFDIDFSSIFLIYLLRQGQQCKNKQMELHQTKKLLHSEGNYQQNEKVTY